jgi:tetratricopeptide (TPR) repeat protein
LSLLLDALKRAEQEKLTRQGPGGAAESAPAPVPPAAANAPSAAVLELQPMHGAAPSAGVAARGADAHAAQAVFKAKSAQELARNRGMLWAVGAAIGVVVLAAGAYIWYSINTLTPQMRSVTRVPRPSPILPPASDPGAPRAEAPFVPPAPPADRSAAAANVPPAPETPAREEPREPRSAVDELLARPSATAPDSVKLTRTEEPKPSVPPNVDAGYHALVAGDLATARARYAAQLAADPTNVDALLGLATAEARSGDAAAAAQRYRRVLELDPVNATAAAGLAALADYVRPEAVESGLRADLARNPDSAALHFTLGNVYARQSRWGEAQAEFFEAFRLDPASADTAFNLAVSLDHLGSRKAAAEYYRRALAAAGSAPRQFEPADVRRRLADLERR